MKLEEPAPVALDRFRRLRRERLGDVRFETLWAAGSLTGLEGNAIAVVGSRAPSDAGRARARAIGRELAAAGACILSGLALGIDGAAHEGALEAGGLTVGILGGGHRCFFPLRNRVLAERMIEAGGAVLSPYPPDEPARPPQFIQRNGVIAALADAVVVVEAAARSGSLNTAGWANDRGIPVFAVPGDVDRPKAAGCNALIRDGATLARDAADVLADLKLAPCAGAAQVAQHALSAPPGADEALVRRMARALAADGAPFDALFERLACDGDAPPALERVLANLSLLELYGALRRDDDGRWRLASNEARR